MATLYELTNEFKELLFLAETEELDPQTIKDTLESLNYELEDKADGYGKVIRELEGQANTLDSEIKRLSDKKASIQNNISNMKQALFQSMKETNNPKIKTNLFTFTISKNGGKQPIDIYGEVPEEYSKVEIRPDNDKIREALSKGEQLDFAILQERGEHLRIK